jgi:RHS repeat-associated protein
MQPFDWLRGGEEKNKFLYNGVEQDDYSKYYETSYRSYDASLGRFMQADPLAEMTMSLSPYQFGNNNPIRYNDPSGLLVLSEAVLEWIEDMYNSTPDDGFSIYTSGGGIHYYGNTGNGNYSETEGYGSNYNSNSTSPGGNLSIFQNGDGSWTARITEVTDYTATNSNFDNQQGNVSLDSYDVPFPSLVPTSSQWSINQNGGSFNEQVEGISNFWLDVSVGVNAIFVASIEIATNPSQKPLYWGLNDFKAVATKGKALGTKLSVAGAVISVGEAVYNPTGGNATDAVFGVIGVIPGYGTAIGSIYFGIDLITTGLTGKGISDHIDSYIWMPSPVGAGFIPIAKIPGK